MKNYFEEFYNRYEELKSDLEKIVGDLSSDKNLIKAISGYHQLLNNIVMAGLGMGTLYLRMGAVLMIAEKTNKSADENDISFLKVIAEKLIHKLPADGDWLEIWKKFLEKDKQCKWYEIISKSTQPKIHDAFVSLRNDIAHQKIVISETSELSEIQKALKTLDAMTSFRTQFEQSIISIENNEVYFQYESDKEKLKISPYVQINKSNEPDEVGVLPYLFQGRYYKGAKFINPEGTETKEQKDEAVDDTFEKIKNDISRFNGDKSFNFAEKINNYNEWCIGRKEEVNCILKWINNAETDKNVLPIFAPAGLGKGALVAKVIENLKEKNIKHLFHYCGSGAANNLQAILYGLIIQGGWDKDFNKIINEDKKSIWNVKNLSPKLQNRFARFPTQYTDVIELFQALLDSTEPEIEPLKEITDKDFDEAFSIRNEQRELNINEQFKDICDLLYKISEHKLHKRTSELLDRIELLLSDKTNLKLKEKNYNRLIEISINLNKHNFENNLLSYIPKDYSQVSNTDNKIKKEVNSKLVIIIDGLDEAAVADHSKRISDWFYTYKVDAPNADDIRSKRADKWISPKHIKWIFTFRYTKDESKKIKQYDYPNEIKAEFNIEENESLQPLKPINITAEELNKALMKDLREKMNENAPTLTDDFIIAVLEKGKIKDDKAESLIK
jgi:hypothetical protein